METIMNKILEVNKYKEKHKNDSFYYDIICANDSRMYHSLGGFMTGLNQDEYEDYEPSEMSEDEKSLVVTLARRNGL